MWKCPKCGTTVLPDETCLPGEALPVCARCGGDESPEMQWVCYDCGKPIDAGFDLCVACAAEEN